ncbi:Uncharacterized protein SCF082_LOCUS6872, partial [Durusdinium trenchii]
MAWSFKAMLAGTWPDRDWNDKLYHPDSELGSKANQPLAGQFYGCLIAIKGDLEFYNQSLGLPRLASTAKAEATQWKEFPV